MWPTLAAARRRHRERQRYEAFGARWLALFDLLQRQKDRVAFDRLAMQYVMQFERSAPAWEEGNGDKPDGGLAAHRRRCHRRHRASDGIVGHSDRRAAPRRVEQDARRPARPHVGDRLRRHRRAPSRQRAGGSAAVGARLAVAEGIEARQRDQQRRRTRARGGEGAWLLALELLQWTNDRAAFEDRAIEFAMAFELSPPSWEPPVGPKVVPVKAAEPDEGAFADADEQEMVKWSGVMTGSLAPGLGKLADSMHGKHVVAVDMTEVERIDFVCAGALLNLIGRIESQHKSVQIVGASPIIRALLLLIGVSPRHFVKKPQ
jgi:ABC-type transporter Mla MlaB component